MTTLRFCDSCGAELWKEPCLRYVDSYEDGTAVYELCERCGVTLRHWIKNKTRLPEGKPT